MSDFVVNISAKIATMLREVEGIQVVYEYEPDKPEDGKYPYATVTQDRFEGQFGDTIRNLRKYIFVVRLYQERTAAGFGNQKAETVIKKIIDRIITKFDDNTRLDGLVQFVKPVGGNLQYIDREFGDTRVCEITLECTAVTPSIT